jgi:hypothetical protein
LFVSPHAADDSVGEVTFVGSAGFATGLAFGGLAVQIRAGVVSVALLGDAGDAEHTGDAPVASEVEAMFDGFASAVVDE